MSDLVEFLKARLDEDEELARQAIAPDWEVAPEDRFRVQVVPAEHAVGRTSAIAVAVGYEANHIARHDPARVLREVEAKRRILADAEFTFTESEKRGEDFGIGLMETTLALLALAYSDHPDYREAWRV